MNTFVRRMPGAFKDACNHRTFSVLAVFVLLALIGLFTNRDQLAYWMTALSIVWLIIMIGAHYPEAYAKRINDQEK